MSAALGRREAAFGLALVMTCGCGSCDKTDAERAAEERAQAEERWKKSNAILPWRALKGSVRSSGAEPRPEVYARWDAMVRVADAAAVTEYLVWLAAHRDQLTEFDEDKFPTVLGLFAGKSTPLPEWYDSGADHVLVTMTVLLLDGADAGNKLPVGEIAFYELSRAEPKPGWPGALTALARYARGVAFLLNELHYAANEELAIFEEAALALPEDQRALVATILKDALTQSKLPPAEQGKHVLVALGAFTRAANFAKLKRDEDVTLSVERGLEALEALGIENELTLWGWALVHQRRGRYDKSAESLRKLAKTPYLDDATKAEIEESAAEIEKEAKDPGLFRSQATTLAVLRALIARAGGAEVVLAAFVGQEQAAKIVAPFKAVDETFLVIEQATSTKRIEGLADEGMSQMKERGGSLWDRLARLWR